MNVSPKISFSLKQKFIFLFAIMLLLHIIFTGITAFFVFQKILEKELTMIDFKTAELKTQIERYYEEKSDVYKLPELSSEINRSEDDSKVIKENVERKFPGMEFSIKTIQGIVQYKEDPKLIYNSETKDYSFKITREIRFEKNLPFNSLELSVKLNFFKIIIKSLVVGSLVAAFIIIPLLTFMLTTIIKPLVDISFASQKIALGELGVQVYHKSKDEIGALVQSFNYMSNELYKIKEIRDDLLATVSHELRSPLARIQGYAELLLDLELDEFEIKNYYKSILSEVDFLNGMAGEIIEVSRLELNKQKLFLEKIDMGFFFDILKEDLEVIEKARNITLNFTYNYGIICEIDVEKFSRVLVNIIHNSINAKATQINVVAEVRDYKYTIHIIDNGNGLKEEHFELVFEKFYRVDKSRDRETGGFGLGLAICRGILHEHGGKIYFIKPKSELGAHMLVELKVSDRLS